MKISLDNYTIGKKYIKNTPFKAILLKKELRQPEITDKMLDIIKSDSFPPKTVMFKYVDKYFVQYVLFGNTPQNEALVLQLLKEADIRTAVTKTFIDITKRTVNSLSELATGELRKLKIKKAISAEYLKVDNQKTALQRWRYVNKDRVI